MRTRTRGVAALLGATALASTAYGIGTQSDGNAIAARAGSSAQSGEARGPRGDHLADLAERLGVSESKLRSALEELRPGRGDGPRRDSFLAPLAEELGVSTSKLEDALREARGSRGEGRPGGDRRPGHGPRGHRPGRGDSATFVRRLAAALDMEQSKVRAALEKVREAHEKEHEERHEQFVKDLAEKLGISESKVREVFADGPRGGHGPGGHRRP